MNLALFRQPAGVLAGAWTVNALAYSIVYPFLPLYLHRERGIPMAEVGLIFPLMGAALIAAPPVAGILTDRFGRIPVFQSGQFARAGIFLLLAAMALLHAPFWLFAAVLTLNAAVGVGFQVASNAYVNDISTEEERPRVFSGIRIGNNLGWALGPMLGAFLVGLPFAWLFLLTALLCVAGALYTGRFCREIRIAHTPLKGRHLLAALALPRSHPELRRLLLAGFLLFILSSQLYSILSVYATGVVKINSNSLGFLYSINGFFIILFQLPITRQLEKRRWSFPRRLLLGAALYTLGYLSLGFAVNWSLLALAVIIITLGEAAAVPTIYAAAGRGIPPELSGQSMALLELVRGTAYALGPYIGSLVFEQYSSSPILLWAFLSSFGIFAFIGFTRLHR